MQNHKSNLARKAAAGFTLPVILVVVSALLILAVGVLLLIGIERNTARSFVDRQRAELAAKSGLEDVRGIFTQEAANDDFLVIQSTLAPPAAPATNTRQLAPELFLARGVPASGEFRYVPLFSAISSQKNTPTLSLPVVEPLVGTTAAGYKDFETLPYLDKARAAWLPVVDDKDRMVARYAYWVEDLQSRVDAGTAGNTKDTGGAHLRYGWKAATGLPNSAKFPAPGLNAEISVIGSDGRDTKPPLDQVALYSLDPASGAKDDSNLDKTIIDGRKALVSPDSVLAVSGIAPPLLLPLTRDSNGHLVDLKARAVEEGLTASVKPYDEQPLVPFANGIASSVTGKPKLNLNALLAEPSDTAVEKMAAWIKQGLPKFDQRKGGFPATEDYIKTLAANAIDYADADSDATVKPNSYRGLDSYPLMSEIIQHTKYLGVVTVKGRKVLAFQVILYVELWNHTNFSVTGAAKVSYENGLQTPGFGSGVQGTRFDAPALLDDPNQPLSVPPLTKIGDRYWSGPIAVNLGPNQYQFYKAEAVNYYLDAGAEGATLQNTFEMFENFGTSGMSMMWNDREVDRSNKFYKGLINPTEPGFKYTTTEPRQSGKAYVPGHSYVNSGHSSYKNNMGDSREALYLRSLDYVLADNAYPENISPNRRNIRNKSIYKSAETPEDVAKVHGRVLPSEWPDGGHDTPVSIWSPITSTDKNYDPTTYPPVTNAQEGEAPTFLSNRGRFYSATELGRIYDPIMFTPTFDPASESGSSDTTSIRKGIMPSGRVSWPSVEISSPSDICYGGGNTLRIGRPEHAQFDKPALHAPSAMPGTNAARLLDLFHAGKSRSEVNADREGPLVRIEGHINLNTASPDAIRAMAAGLMQSDPRLSLRNSDNTHSASTWAPPVTALEVSTPTNTKEADVLADAIIRGRPYASPSEIASALNADGKLAFGNRDLLPAGNKVQWSDAAAEEAFARVYEASTVRSRNFRVWVIGQALAPTGTTNTAPEVQAEVRRAYTVFVDPGARKADGTIDPTKFRVTNLNENDF